MDRQRIISHFLRLVATLLAALLASVLFDVALLFVIENIMTWQKLREFGLQSRADLANDLGSGFELVGLAVVGAVLLPVFFLAFLLFFKRLFKNRF